MRVKNDIRCSRSIRNPQSFRRNQQKVILARELEAHPDLLVAVHPTRGLDIARPLCADTMIEARVQRLRRATHQRDFDEVLQLSDRIVVIFEGRIMANTPAAIRRFNHQPRHGGK
jgi:simple sugar transport system ATP-binding protein